MDSSKLHYRIKESSHQYMTNKSKYVLRLLPILTWIAFPIVVSGNEAHSQSNPLVQERPDTSRVSILAESDSLKLPEKKMSTSTKVALGVLVFSIVEGGIFIHSGVFAQSPVGGSAFAGIAGLLAALNSDPKTAKISIGMAGSWIAYNLIRFGPETKVSESRSLQIFTENMILANVGIATSIAISLYLDKPKSGKKESPVSLQIAPDMAGISCAWRF